MSEPLADSDARLKLLLEQVMKEPDPLKYDELGTEIWRALSERERLRLQAKSEVHNVHD
jgi:hypothetical protein